MILYFFSINTYIFCVISNTSKPKIIVVHCHGCQKKCPQKMIKRGFFLKFLNALWSYVKTLRHENNRSVNKLIFDKSYCISGFYLLKVIPLDSVWSGDYSGIFFIVLSRINCINETKKLANIEILKNIFEILYFTDNNFINWGNYINKGHYNSTTSTKVYYHSLTSWFNCSKSLNGVICCLSIIIYLL